MHQKIHQTDIFVPSAQKISCAWEVHDFRTVLAGLQYQPVIFFVGGGDTLEVWALWPYCRRSGQLSPIPSLVSKLHFTNSKDVAAELFLFGAVFI
jgi:hypothetical protein